MSNQDTNNPLWGLLGFIVPIAGIVLYLVWRFERIRDSKYALIGAIIGAVIQLAASIALRFFLFDLFIDGFI
jgi:urea transporter